ncbi:MAG: 2Fe-2S iron-sulfur cluster-binding protein [Rhizobiaceae bacterium]
MSFRRIDTSGKGRKPVHFTFDGKRQSGYEGETLAVALLANGQDIFGRSFKYHRPRGLFAPGNAEPNALVTLIRGAFREPNIRATEVEIFDGLVAESQNRFPSLAHDIGAVNGLAGKLFSAGFYYKTFMGPGIGPLRSTKFWMLCEKLIRRAAGLGRVGMAPDQDRYDRINAFCDVLVIGGGDAGRVAAETAAKAGLRVILADANPQTSLIDGVQILTRTFVWGVYDGNTYTATERVADHKSSRAPGEPRQRHWVIRARTAIHATGATERPIVFPGNDVPGVMLASMAKDLCSRGLVPDGPVVLLTNNDAAYQTAADLAAAGANVCAIIDVRSEVSAAARALADLCEAELHIGRAITATQGKAALKSISIQNFNGATGAVSGESASIDCTTLAVSGGWSPSIQLASQAGGKPAWSEPLQAFLPPDPAPGQDFHVCGSAAGIFGRDEAKADAKRAAESTIANLAGTGPEAATNPDCYPAYFAAPIHEIRGGPKSQKAFVDFQHDVTADDIRLAAREGYSSPEHMKRYTTLGMATEQGRNAAIPALAILGGEQGKTIAETGTTRFRPPASGVSFGVLAAERYGDLQPDRRTPMHDWHLANGATLYAAGLWHRPMIYGRTGETIEQSYVREARAVRMGVGIVDVSTLGKIDIQGPDAGKFLDRVYTNMFSNLAVSKARYGLMLREDGLVMDDGTTWRLGENQFLMTTTTANAGKVMQHLDYCLDCLWPDLKVHLTSVTDQWAGAAVSGPFARKVLEACVVGTEVDTEALPFMGIVHGMIADLPVMICRLSFSGELAYEVYSGAGHGQRVWNALMEAGKPFTITPYGLEALGTLRIEKGHVTGAEIDGRTTAHDLHLEWMLSKKKPFIGQAMMNRPGLIDENRLTLVGILSSSGKPISGGSHIVEEDELTEPAESFGHVTAACYSPALEKYIALALVKNGKSRIGTTAYATAPLTGQHLPVEIVDCHMFDPEGRRMHV